MPKFKLVKDDVGIGHHFFVDKNDCLIITDHSIDGKTEFTPENSDDGVLYVDFSRPITKSGEYLSMPIKDSDGIQSSTYVTEEDAIFAQQHAGKVFSLYSPQD